MFLRDNVATLEELGTVLAERDESHPGDRVSPHDFEFHLDERDNPSFTINGTQVAQTETGLSALGDILQIPSSFLKRLDQQVSASTKNGLLSEIFANKVTSDLKVAYNSHGIVSLSEWGAQRVEPAQLVEVAAKILTPEAQVARLIDRPGTEFAFDVYAPESLGHGYGGLGTARDNEGAEVNDLTAGGLRFFLDVKHGLAPSVQTWLYRLVCTNGMEVPTFGTKVDARGLTVDAVLAEIEEKAQIAFGQVERQIEHFYDLKSQRVDNAERAIAQIAREYGVSDRVTMNLVRLAASEDLPDEPSQFDIVNLITNYANSPDVRRDGTRLILESAGGSVVSEHAARCGHCQQKITV